MQSIDPISKIEEALAGNIANPIRRIEIATRVFQVNEMLGEKYGYDRKDYELAEEYHKEYFNGICKAFKEKRISIETSKEILKDIGHRYAKEKLLERIEPEKWGVPMIFPSTMPGAYFEEKSIRERVTKSPGFEVKYRAERPVKVGTEEWKTLQKELENRKKQGINSTLTTAILPSKDVWVLPAFFEEGVRSQHSTCAAGNPCVWAGEVDYERMRDKTGHYRCFNAQKPSILSDFALSVLQEHGFDTSKMKVEFVLIHGTQDLEFKVSSRPTELGPVQASETFLREAQQCGSTFYFDRSLESAKAEEAYLMYRRAREGARLKFAVTGRLQIGDEEAEERNDPSLLIPSDELYPAIDSAMHKNLLLMDDNYAEKRDGSIFCYPYKDWTFLINDAWLLGSIHAKVEMHIASPLQWDNFCLAHENRMSMMARELIGLTASGYELTRPSQKLEVVAVCVDEEKAKKTTLLTLKAEVEKYQTPETLKQFFQSLPDSIKGNELSPQQSAELLDRIMPIVALAKERRRLSQKIARAYWRNLRQWVVVPKRLKTVVVPERS